MNRLTLEQRSLLDQLEAFAFLPEGLRDFVAASFENATYQFGDEIVRQGEPADAFFVVVHGRARVYQTTEAGDELPLNLLQPGDSFGEIALLEGGTRSASVRASGAVTLAKLNRSVFQAWLDTHPEIRRSFELAARQRVLNSFLKAHSTFETLPPPIRRRLIEGFDEVRVEAGETVVTEGERGDAMFVVEDGRLRVAQVEDGARRDIRYLRRGDTFGEIALYKQTTRTATVETTSAATLLCLGRAEFEALVKESPEFRAMVAQRIAEYDNQETTRVPLDFADDLRPSAREAPLGEEPPTDLATKDAVGRLPLVHQIDASDCGAACLAMICRYYGRPETLLDLRRQLHTSRSGTTLMALQACAEALGFNCASRKGVPEDLLQLELPAIVHWQGEHWVVLYATRNGECRVADPAYGHRRLASAEFLERWTGYALTFSGRPPTPTTEQRRRSTTAIPELVRGEPSASRFGAAIALLHAVMLVILAWGLGSVADGRGGLGVGLTLSLTVGALALLSHRAATFRTQRLAAVARTTTRRTLAKLLNLPVTYFAQRLGYDLENRARALQALRALIRQDVPRWLAGVTLSTAALAALCCLVPRLGLLALVGTGVTTALARRAGRATEHVARAAADFEASLAWREADLVRGIAALKTAGAVDQAVERTHQAIEGAQHERRPLFQAAARAQAHTQWAALATTGLVILLAARAHAAGALAAGALVTTTLWMALAQHGMHAWVEAYWRGKEAAPDLDRLADVQDAAPERAASGRPVASLAGAVEAAGLTVSYGGPDAPAAVDGASFEIRPGRWVAVVGRDGAGKSTLAQCVATLLPPTTGTLRFDGVGVGEVALLQLRRQLAYTDSPCFVTSDTVAANIALGAAERDMDRVAWAATVTHADQFIAELPWGYDTVVGLGGFELSASQRQRLGLARAVYRQPAVLILDEAFLHLSLELERLVRASLRAALGDTTVVAVESEARAARDADWILVLERGKLVEEGTHDQLVDRQGLYAHLVGAEKAL